METIHHHAISGPAWHEDPDAEYRPFSGYGRNGGAWGYPVCSAWKGTSIIPHHIAVESREDGIANGRVYHGPTPEQIAARRVDQTRARPRTIFRMDARHAALDDASDVKMVIVLPDAMPTLGAPLGIRSVKPKSEPARFGQLVGARG